MPILSFEIEVNVARKGCEPIWRSLTDEYEDTLVWHTEEEVREVLAEEGRGENARIMRFVNGIGSPIP